jgi:hypothetical protein
MPRFRDTWRRNPSGPPKKTRTFGKAELAGILRREEFDSMYNNPVHNCPACIASNPGRGAIKDRKVAVALLEHHIEDLYEGLRMGSLEIASFSMKDIAQIWNHLSVKLRKSLSRRFLPRIAKAKKALQSSARALMKT